MSGQSYDGRSGVTVQLGIQLYLFPTLQNLSVFATLVQLQRIRNTTCGGLIILSLAGHKIRHIM